RCAQEQGSPKRADGPVPDSLCLDAPGRSAALFHHGRSLDAHRETGGAPDSVHLALLPEPEEVTAGLSVPDRAKLADWDKLMEVHDGRGLRPKIPDRLRGLLRGPKGNGPMSARLRSAVLIAGVAIFDRITKLYIRMNFNDADQLPVIRGFFNIVHVENPGAAF